MCNRDSGVPTATRCSSSSGTPALEVPAHGGVKKMTWRADEVKKFGVYSKMWKTKIFQKNATDIYSANPKVSKDTKIEKKIQSLNVQTKLLAMSIIWPKIPASSFPDSLYEPLTRLRETLKKYKPLPLGLNH